ncbi:MAG: transcriptional regulator NrdR [Aeromicrobium sp.]|uniref:transcriptional regulator NrdR n=1 Tax=Aeromicrobium sp. TaxID=1871063 RepID=UPI0039E31527
MHCPFCRHTDTRVIDSRVADEGASIRRRRVCSACEKRFTTIEQMQLMVVKRSGATEPFVRDKAVAGVRKACKGRPVSDDDLARLGQRVEGTLREAGCAEVPAHEVGLAVLEPLKELDEVAYLRFASVYKAFDSADDFAAEIAALMSRSADGELAADQQPAVTP